MIKEHHEGDENLQIHVVQKGDSLTEIANRYHSTINQIALANELEDPNVLVVGEALIIPIPGQQYVVEQGDYLVGIAEKLGITVAALAEENNILDPNLIYVGRVLQLPYVNYTVQRGDSVYSIANQFGTSVQNIVNMNNLQQNNVIYPGQVLTIPSPTRPPTEVNAYTTTMNERGREEVLMLGSYFTYVTPFSYGIKEDGSLAVLDDELVLDAAFLTGTAPLLVLTNFQNGKFSSDLVATILRNPGLQMVLINNLLSVMNEKGYKGLNIDFEYVYPEDRENYNMFLRRVTDELHANRYLVSTAVAPKESANQPGLLYEAHDYRAHGEIVDFVVIMTYEWGWAGGQPLAIAPINKVKQVLDYAVTEIAPDKIMMGAPLYGRDWRIPWVQGTIARTVSPQEAVQLAKRYRVDIQYNDLYQSPFFIYTDETGQAHEVWFEDARSMQAKYDVVKDYGLRGVSYWVLGSPFPQNWGVLGENFKTVK